MLEKGTYTMSSNTQQQPEATHTTSTGERTGTQIPSQTHLSLYLHHCRSASKSCALSSSKEPFYSTFRCCRGRPSLRAALKPAQIPAQVTEASRAPLGLSPARSKEWRKAGTSISASQASGKQAKALPGAEPPSSCPQNNGGQTRPWPSTVLCAGSKDTHTPQLQFHSLI